VPQSVVDVPVSTQPLPQSVWPIVGHMHEPPTQPIPVEHAWLHAPQFVVLVEKSVHTPPHCMGHGTQLPP
jgi:hypothetical protein